MGDPPGADKFSVFLTKNGIPKARAARDLQVSHVTVLNWVTRRAVPTHDRRQAIAVWTGGEVSESDWISTEERARLERFAEVQPFVPEGAAE